jgi:hypothetical protein
MIYDVPFRHQQALDPSALDTVLATVHAINKGIEDCRTAGLDPNSDPAITLLTRHLADVTSNRAGDATLRGACSRRIAELQRFPALLALSIRGVAFDQAAKDRFHADARKAMGHLARLLLLGEDAYKVTSNPGDISISGDVTLQTADLEVAVSVGPAHEGHEVSYHAKRGPLARTQKRHAAILELLRPAGFAARLRRELQLEAEPPVAELAEPDLLAASGIQP